MARLRRTGHYEEKMQLLEQEVQSGQCHLTPKASAADGRWWVVGWRTQNSGPAGVMGKPAKVRGSQKPGLCGDRTPVSKKGTLQSKAGPGIWRHREGYKGGKDLGSGNNAGIQEQNQEAGQNCSRQHDQSSELDNLNVPRELSKSPRDSQGTPWKRRTLFNSFAKQ